MGKKKEMLGSVRVYARSEGRTLKHGGTRSVHIYILPGYDSFFIISDVAAQPTGAALHGKRRTGR
jgi:hypothetical protein